MSSVRGLNARPQTANVNPARSAPKCRVTFSIKIPFCRSFTFSTALRSTISGSSLAHTDHSADIFRETGAAVADTGKDKMRPDATIQSEIALRTSPTSAPFVSHSREISLMKDIFVASIAFAAYLLISALRLVHHQNGIASPDEGFVKFFDGFQELRYYRLPTPPCPAS